MRNLRSHPTQRRDHYQELTDRIVAALEAGVAPWRRPCLSKGLVRKQIAPALSACARTASSEKAVTKMKGTW
jgi:antirestriction protein ArdC